MGEKWLGFCHLLRCVDSGTVKLDVSRFLDVTITG